MDKVKSLKEAINPILIKYKDTPLVSRWQEAIAFGEGEKASSYWIRDTEDVVNIVWLNKNGIRDITWSPSNAECMLNYVPLRNIVTFEVREKDDVGRLLVNVKGSYVVHVIPLSGAGLGELGPLWWVAENEESKQRLQAFLSVVLEDYSQLR